LYNHYRKKHEDGEFSCTNDGCTYTRNRRYLIIKHSCEHTRTQTKCPHCDYTASSKALKVHIRSHSSQRQFVCTHCPKTFIQQALMKLHIELAHTETQIRYHCT